MAENLAERVEAVYKAKLEQADEFRLLVNGGSSPNGLTPTEVAGLCLSATGAVLAALVYLAKEVETLRGS